MSGTSCTQDSGLDGNLGGLLEEASDCIDSVKVKTARKAPDQGSSSRGRAEERRGREQRSARAQQMDGGRVDQRHTARGWLAG